MKKVAGKIRLELAQFRELEAFMQFASDLDEDTKVRIESGRKYTELLKQDQHATLPFYMQVISIYGANNTLLDGARVQEVRAIEAKFHEHMEREQNAVIEAIKNERAISDESEVKLKEAIHAFKAAHPELYTA